MIGQNNNNSNNTPDKTINIYLNPTPTQTQKQNITQNKNTNTIHLPETDKPKILQLQQTYNLKQLETFTKMNEYKKWSEMIIYVQDNFDRVKLELAECDAKELKAFIDLYQEKMRLNEG